MNIHESINNKLNMFIENNDVPNILINGPSGSGKRYLVNNFIKNIYNNDRPMIDTYVLNFNYALFGGIKFIREDIKYFCKTNIKNKFKIVVLDNAHELTTDAQSALRRCIEIFNFNTRFIIITTNKRKILKPILSRFCEINVPLPTIKNKQINLHNYLIENNITKEREDWLKKYLKKITLNELDEHVEKLYNKAYSATDIINLIKKKTDYDDKSNTNDLLMSFTKIKREFRSEKLLMYFVLYFIYFRSNHNLENIIFI